MWHCACLSLLSVSEEGDSLRHTSDGEVLSSLSEAVSMTWSGLRLEVEKSRNVEKPVGRGPLDTGFSS